MAVSYHKVRVSLTVGGLWLAESGTRRLRVRLPRTPTLEFRGVVESVMVIFLSKRRVELVQPII